MYRGKKISWQRYNEIYNIKIKTQTNSLVENKIHIPLSKYLTFALYKTSLSANHISLIGFLIVLFGAYMLSNENLLMNILGICIMQFGSILDYSDGQIARLKNIQSKFGAVWDYFLDRILTIIIPLYLLMQTRVPTERLYYYIVLIFPILIYDFMTEIVKFNSKNDPSVIETRRNLNVLINVGISFVETPVLWLMYGISIIFGLFPFCLIVYGLYHCLLLFGLIIFSWKNLK